MQLIQVSDACAVSFLYFPTTQGTHVSEICAELVWYLPATQLMQLSDVCPTLSLYLPATHEVQVDADEEEYVPAIHCRQASGFVPPGLSPNLPALQSVHGSPDIRTLLYLPEAHMLTSV
jgi:hypothetical protein